MPKISIIVPVYNVENYIEKCIKSIIAQTFKDFELILIDDGSTDNSGYICDKYLNLDSRIKVIHKENTGVSDTRNLGLKVATGDYIGFVDSDDFIDKLMYEKLYDESVNNHSDMIIIGLREIDGKGKTLNEYIPKNINLNEIMKRAYPCNKIFKRELFIKNNLYFNEGKFYEDVALIPKLFVKSTNISHVKYIGYNYLKRSNSTTNKRDEKILDNLWAYTEIKSYLLKENLYREYKFEFEQATKYFKIFYADILYDYPTTFLIRNSSEIIKNFRLIDKIKFSEYLIFIKRHINVASKRLILNFINKIGELIK